MNEVSARLVAGGVVLLAATAIVSGQSWLVAAIAYGFVARVLSGPRLSPLAQLVTRVITPRLATPPRWVAGPPKRFALLMRAGVIPPGVCENCSDIWSGAQPPAGRA